MNKKITRNILLTTVLILLVVASVTLYIGYPFTSNEKVNVKGTSIIYQNQIVENEKVKRIDEEAYVRFSFVKETIDPTIVYDQPSQSVIITMPRDVYQLPTGEGAYELNQEEYDLHFPVTTSENGETWLAVEWLRKVYPMYFHLSEYALSIYEDDSTRQVAEVITGLEEKQTKVRQQSDITSPYYINLEPGDKVYLIGEEDSFYKILTEQGYSGFISKDAVDNIETITLQAETTQQSRKDITRLEKPFHVTWDAIYSAAATPSEVESKPGVDVLSPTWFSLIDEQGSIENFASTDYVESAHAQGDEVWALFSNGFDPDLTHKVLPSFEKRQHMIRQLLDFARIYNLDGINIDFENVYLEDGPWLTQFVRELTPLAHEAGLIVSVDVAFPNGSAQWSRFLEHQKLAEAADYLMVMAYDEHWANSPEAGSVASLPWVRGNTEALLELVPSEKLLLGIPLYTRLWTEETLENGEVEVSSESFSMEEAAQWMAERQLTPEYNDDTGQNIVTYKEGDKTYTIWLEDETSIKNRIELMKKFDLAGLASWSESFADEQAWNVIDRQLDTD
ncbi:peptidoglycan hydrolase [Halobacillus locisalis]|uniref:Peptidoglycan hydrolase n=1 Tax=Halobacillus locisalis TaxID=220753 RepID=A0A838CQG2_9BACI|nr:glycosyl hydrolase family 18 protein [Halobacillus locisalis]MBA2173995.1 peptidoglycan hydrolase [Halobacillus locisalis]